MYTRLWVLAILLFATVWQSCSPYGYTYVSPIPNTPSFTGGGQAKGMATVGILGASANAAVSPVRHLGFGAGYYIGYKGFQCFSYSTQLYTPLFNTKKAGRFYAALQVEKSHGIFNRNYTDKSLFIRNGESIINAKINYLATNIMPSVYTVLTLKGGDIVKIGFGLQFTNAVYKDFYFKRDYFIDGKPDKWGNLYVNAPGVIFKRVSPLFYLFFESKRLPIFGYAYYGITPNNYNAKQINMQDLQSGYRFRGTLNCTNTVGIYLDWKKHRKKPVKPL